MTQQPLKKASTRTRGRKQLDLGVLNEFVGYKIRKAQVLVYADFMIGQPQPALTPGLFGLLVLIEANPTVTQQDLCEAINVDKSTLVVTLHRLADRGLIRRVRSTEDRRQNVLKLTAKGMTKYKAMLEHIHKHEKRITAGLSEKECEQLVALLARVGQHA
jgi:DNA-binding MarR family transcriptional regulator